MSLRPTYISLDSPMRNEKERSDYFGAPSSPLAAPPMLPDSPDSFHSASPALTALMTPEGDYAGSQSGMLKSDHKILAALAQSSPELGSEADASENFKSGSLLPAHHPFRQKLALKTQRSESDHEQSPPHTPKGHPVEFSKLRWPKPKTHPISNPYPKAGTTLSYLRVPRRFRPIALIAFCLVVFGLIHLNNAAQQSRQLKTFSHQQAAALGRRQAELSERREVQRKAVWAQMAAAAVESLAPAPEPIAFEDTSEELAALIAFVTSTTSNALPMLDPTVPLDPSIVLDFDPTRAGAREDLDLLINEINTIYPLVLLGKMRDPWHREMKQILSEFKITPAPLVIDIDQRRDHRVFIPLLARLLGNDELPQLLLHGKPLGSYHELVELKEKGKFASILEDGNVLVQNVKKKKKGVKERERIENERVLGPAPIKEDD